MGQALDEFVELRGARLRVRMAGKGPAVLFVHGWTLDLDMWAPQFATLASRYRLIAFDRRGFGQSTGTPGLDQDLADITELLAELAIERVAIVGMSQGARVALRWVLRSPEMTTCLVLDGPPSEGEIPLATYRELVRSEGIEAFRAQWLEHPLMRLRTRDTRVHALLREMIGRYPGHDLPTADAESLHVDRLDLPVLVINGEYDSRARIDAGADLAQRLPDARLAVIPDAGHLANLDNPGAYNAVLGEFLSTESVPCRAE